jgi:hypothetical protein
MDSATTQPGQVLTHIFVLHRLISALSFLIFFENQKLLPVNFWAADAAQKLTSHKLQGMYGGAPRAPHTAESTLLLRKFQ